MGKSTKERVQPVMPTRNFVSCYPDKKLTNASMHFAYQPVDMLLVDVAGDTVSYVDKQSGEVIHCPVLVCVLPFGGYSYAMALPNASQPHLVKALNQCLAFFGGGTANFKRDNINRSCKKVVAMNPSLPK